MYAHLLAAWHNGNINWHINEFAVRQAWLVLGGRASSTDISSRYLYQATQPNSASYPQMGNEYRPNGGDALWLGSKAGRFIPCLDKRVSNR